MTRPFWFVTCLWNYSISTFTDWFLFKSCILYLHIFFVTHYLYILNILIEIYLHIFAQNVNDDVASQSESDPKSKQTENLKLANS